MAKSRRNRRTKQRGGVASAWRAKLKKTANNRSKPTPMQPPKYRTNANMNLAKNLLVFAQEPAFTPPPKIRAAGPMSPYGPKVWVQTPTTSALGVQRYGWATPAPPLELNPRTQGRNNNSP